VAKKQSKIILNSTSLRDESETEYSLRPGVIRQNCNWRTSWCGSRSVNVQSDINLASFVTAIEGKHLSQHTRHFVVTISH